MGKWYYLFADLYLLFACYVALTINFIICYIVKAVIFSQKIQKLLDDSNCGLSLQDNVENVMIPPYLTWATSCVTMAGGDGELLGQILQTYENVYDQLQ
jgi:uncharacterized membrane protein